MGAVLESRFKEGRGRAVDSSGWLAMFANNVTHLWRRVLENQGPLTAQMRRGKQ